MGNPVINFTPGPSQLYFTVQNHMRTAFKEGIPSLSHRSKHFESIYRETTDNLRALLNLPDSYHISFTASATEIWERIAQNLVDTHSTHLVNGSFSQRFYEIARQLGKQAKAIEVTPGKAFENTVPISNTELLAVTHNETSTGVSVTHDFIKSLRAQAPDTIIAVDAVSSLPYPVFDYEHVDTVFFSVQKGFGLPAGLGVWMYSDKCLAKAEALLTQGRTIGSYHSLPSIHSYALKNQTPETPNVLAIYLLGNVIKDMLERGIMNIRRETEYKAAILYQLLNEHPLLSTFVKEKEHQSKTVIVAECGPHTEQVRQLLISNGMLPGDGYGTHKKTQLRFANFPTHSKEQFELLVDTLGAYR